MINENLVFKIRYIPLLKNGTGYGSKIEWVKGCSVIPKLGGSGKTFTSTKIVNRMFNDLKRNAQYGITFRCEIVTFNMTEISKSTSEISGIILKSN